MAKHAGFRKRTYRLEESEMRGCNPDSSINQNLSMERRSVTNWNERC
jgi:hypothetical protein